MIWITDIGLEVHAQLKTQSKLFSNSLTAYGAPANSQTNVVDAGLPGVLPVLNQRAVHMAIQFGLSIQATINADSYFERKHYFYPDLPKGYQVSQLQRPIVGEGHLDIFLPNGNLKRVNIERAHLEEDAGKSIHEKGAHNTFIDLNRAGTPLLEIVTKPCLHSVEEVVCYLKSLQQLLRFLGICDGNMQEGSFRCDVNLSCRPKGQITLGTRTELKNMNSFRFIEQAIQFEQIRHQELLSAKQTIHQETRLYNSDTHQTELMRSKENENDYRYFPDPDLLPIPIDESLLQQLKNTLPERPAEIRLRLGIEPFLTGDDLDFLLSSPAIMAFYDAVKRDTTAPSKIIVNWLKGAYLALLNEAGASFENPPITPKTLGFLLSHVADNTLTHPLAKKILTQLLKKPNAVEELINASKADTQSPELEPLVAEILKKCPAQVADYRAGKEKLLGFFVGQVMKLTQGSIDPSAINAAVLKGLQSDDV